MWRRSLRTKTRGVRFGMRSVRESSSRVPVGFFLFLFFSQKSNILRYDYGVPSTVTQALIGNSRNYPQNFVASTVCTLFIPKAFENVKYLPFSKAGAPRVAGVVRSEAVREF